jgi:signal transduction histidine kinase
LEDALTMVAPSLGRHHVDLIRDVEDVPEISAPKHQIIEILVNLIRNAKQAVMEHNGTVRQIRICIRRHAQNRVRLEVHDTGVGISPENLTRIFAHGFTTKSNGHGFGLHAGALAARQMHGALWAESEGLGCGARFILELPVNAEPIGQS